MLNKKVRDLAVRKAFTDRVKGGEVFILDGLNIENPATADLVKTLNALGVDSKKSGKGQYSSAVLVTGEADSNVALSARNLSKVRSTTSDTLNTYDILWPDLLVFTKDGYEKIEQRLNK